MDPQVGTESIEIKPKSKSLSASDLIAQRHVEIAQFKLGPKRTIPTDSEEEKEVLQKLYDVLRQQISAPRIEVLSGRTLGVWDVDAQAVCVLKKEGKFGNFGYSRNGKHYLEFFEAMFLLELGRLQLEHNSIFLSIEQSYLLLLGEQSSRKYAEYLVYSNLSRVGYILVKYKNLRYYEHVEPTKIDCIWEVCQSEVQNTKATAPIRKSPFYGKVKTEMEDIKRIIMLQNGSREEQNETGSSTSSSINERVNFDRKLSAGTKRKLDNPVEDRGYDIKKRHVITCPTYKSSYIDFLQDEPEFQKFKKTFEHFQIIKFAAPTSDSSTDANCRYLRISFDMHLPNDGFKKSTPKPPTFRLIILEGNGQFPTYAEIKQCHLRQKYAVPLLVVSVSESKQIQAFLYYFN